MAEDENDPDEYSFIRSARQDVGLSQKDLARELGVTQQSVSRWERGGRPDVAYIRPLARALKVEPSLLLSAVGLPYLGEDIDAAVNLLKAGEAEINDYNWINQCCGDDFDQYEDMSWRQIGEYVRRSRLARGTSIASCAAALNMTPRRWRDFENGDPGKESDWNEEKLVTALGRHLFISWPPLPNELETTALSRLRRLSPEMWQQLEETAAAAIWTLADFENSVSEFRQPWRVPRVTVGEDDEPVYMRHLEVKPDGSTYFSPIHLVSDLEDEEDEDENENAASPSEGEEASPPSEEDKKAADQWLAGVERMTEWRRRGAYFVAAHMEKRDWPVTGEVQALLEELTGNPPPSPDREEQLWNILFNPERGIASSFAITEAEAPNEAGGQ